MDGPCEFVFFRLLEGHKLVKGLALLVFLVRLFFDLFKCHI